MTPRRLAHPMTALVLLLAFGAGREAAAGCQPTWGVRLSTPQIVSASAGVLIGQLDPPQPPPPGTHLPSGFLLQLEPGLGGGKLSAGYGIGLLPYAAAGLKLSALRTWGHPLFAKPNQTYLGIEAEATFFVKLSLGVMRRVRGDNSTARVIVTGGIGLGF